LVFDERASILALASARKTKLQQNGGSGYIYGDVDNKPLGGTNFIYVADVQLQSLGLPDVGESASLTIPAMVNAKWLLVPAAAAGVLYLAAWRKMRMEGRE
jgi:hypothetical protein